MEAAAEAEAEVAVEVAEGEAAAEDAEVAAAATATGVVLRRSVFGTAAIVDVAIVAEMEAEAGDEGSAAAAAEGEGGSVGRHAVLVVPLRDQQARAHFQRECKLGDLVAWPHPPQSPPQPQPPPNEEAEAGESAGEGEERREPTARDRRQDGARLEVSWCVVRRMRWWGADRVREAQRALLPPPPPPPPQQQQQQKQKQQKQRAAAPELNPSGGVASADDGGDDGHGSGAEKRRQGEVVAAFLLSLVRAELGGEGGVAALSHGSGVVDVAGGSGHVSLALLLEHGVTSTVVDPRATAGCLPRRDRKALRKAREARAAAAATAAAATAVDGGADAGGGGVLGLSQTSDLRTLRAWFGRRPEGADLEFAGGADGRLGPGSEGGGMDGGVDDGGDGGDGNGGGAGAVPECLPCSEDGLLAGCTAIVALHPDEATEAAVDAAVARRVPFVVVPCCVFARLFPARHTPSGTPVRNRAELIEHLRAKHPAIRTAQLPFGGANTVVFATFAEPDDQ